MKSKQFIAKVIYKNQQNRCCPQIAKASRRGTATTHIRNLRRL